MMHNYSLYFLYIYQHVQGIMTVLIALLSLQLKFKHTHCQRQVLCPILQPHCLAALPQNNKRLVVTRM